MRLVLQFLIICLFAGLAISDYACEVSNSCEVYCIASWYKCGDCIRFSDSPDHM
jgi:hypothetical protein